MGQAFAPTGRAIGVGRRFGPYTVGAEERPRDGTIYPLGGYAIVNNCYILFIL